MCYLGVLSWKACFFSDTRSFSVSKRKYIEFGWIFKAPPKTGSYQICRFLWCFEVDEEEKWKNMMGKIIWYLINTRLIWAVALKIVELKRVAFCCCNFYLQLSEKRKISQEKTECFFAENETLKYAENEAKNQCFLALRTVGFWGGIRGAFEKTSHDVYFSNKKSVVSAFFTEIGHHEVRAYNEDVIYPTFQLS